MTRRVSAPVARTRLSPRVLWGVLTMVGACRPPQVDPPAPTPVAVPIPPLPAHESIIPLLVTVDRAQTEQILNTRVRAAIQAAGPVTRVAWNPKDDQDYARYGFQPHRDLRLGLVGGGVVATGGLEYRLEFKDVRGGMSDIFINCPSAGDGGTWPRLRVEATAAIGLQPDWQLKARADLTRFEEYSKNDRDDCKLRVLFFNIDVISRLKGYVEPQVKAQLANLGTLAAALPVKAAAERMWAALRTPIALGANQWLVLDPQEVSVGTTTMRGADLTFALSPTELSLQPTLRLRPRIVTGGAPGASGAAVLPPLVPQAPISTFTVTLDAVVDRATLSQQLNATLAGTAFKVGKKTVTIRNAEVLDVASDSLRVKLGFDGSAKGTLYLTGVPTYNAVSGELQVRNVTYDLATKNILLRVASWWKGDDIQRALETRAKWTVGPAVAQAQQRLTQQLNRDLAPGVHLSGAVGQVLPIGVWMAPGVATIRVSMAGSAKLALDLSKAVP